jgi:hypothetical protein
MKPYLRMRTEEERLVVNLTLRAKHERYLYSKFHVAIPPIDGRDPAR